MKINETTIVKDSNGLIIEESRSDGFREETEYYDDGQVKRRITTYPNKLIETEHFAKINRGKE